MAGLALAWLPAVAVNGAVNATVTLTDGRTVDGTYLGGTEEIIKLRHGPDVFNIPIVSVRMIAFGVAAPPEPEIHLDLHPAAPPMGEQLVVPAATGIRVKLGQPLSTALSQPGSVFMAIVAEDIKSGETVVIRKGLVAYGRVAAVTPGGRLKREPQLSLVLDSLHFPAGTQPLKTRVWIAPDSPKHGDSASINSSFLTPDNQLSLPSGTELEFFLVQPVLIPQ
jgi:hypothetical protein